LRERDEARKYAQACEWALEAEQEYTARLKADLALECREVAERQREACADAVHADLTTGLLTPAAVTRAVRAVKRTPLVTEVQE
jgi:hypothetical protein